jgi:hypothetical protein
MPVNPRRWHRCQKCAARFDEVNFDQLGNNEPVWGSRFRIDATSSSKRRMAGVPVLRRL